MSFFRDIIYIDACEKNRRRKTKTSDEEVESRADDQKK